MTWGRIEYRAGGMSESGKTCPEADKASAPLTIQRFLDILRKDV